jgi:aspartyl-tRNA(Asn)/glutamyl-tRNA(Gln) amidotransferase subunit A
VEAAVAAAIADYRQRGCEIKEISLPHTKYAVGVYYIIATAECSSNLARYDGIRYGHRAENPTDLLDLYYRSRAEGFGAEVKRRIILGTYVLSSGYYDAFYLRAQQVRTLLRQDFLNAYKEVDAILTPTAPTPAFKRGEKAADPLAMYLSDIYTIGVNLAGLPGLSLPCGFSAGGLPIGLQIIGQPFQEAELLAIAHSYEQGHDWHNRHPNL